MNGAAGKLLIISGPSGAGKSTVLSRIARSALPFDFSISATTREPREGEEHGVDYYFLDHADFEQRRQAGEFLECKEVFGQGHWYGTPRSRVASGLEQGKWVVLEIDVEGAAAVLSQAPDATTIFLHPGSMEELEQRLRNRGTESDAAIERRLKVAHDEMQRLKQYQHEVINRVPEEAAAEIIRIAEAAPPTRSMLDA